MLGGGQLGRMFTMAAQSLGYRVAVLDPEPEAPAGAVADLHIAADYDDAAGLERLAGLCEAITTEFENVPARSLSFLEEHATVSPRAQSVAIAQDRGAEKEFIASCGLAVAPHFVIDSLADFDRVPDSFWPGILKARRLGYDGKGQAGVHHAGDAKAAFGQLGGVPCVLEKRLDLDFELSVVVARAADGSTSTFPIAENIHAHGILSVSLVPGPSVTSEIAEQARRAALMIAADLDYVGVLCVEFFVLQGEELIVNEIAPRPHNSGHYSIDACVTSQFEQQARVLARLPLGETRLHSPAVMLNLLGDLWWDGLAPHAPETIREPDWAGVLRYPGAKLHLYGKRAARRGRKMGHVTIVAEHAGDALQQARDIGALLGMAPW
jgi:5-(carboxyamino)imidazole ribonucleotide synthase